MEQLLLSFLEWFKYSAQKPLLFTRPDFWYFFVVIYAVFCAIYKKHFRRNTWLFVVSLFFYFKSSGFFFSLIILSVVINHFIGKGIYKSETKRGKNLYVTLAVLYNLSWLVYFKYTYFFCGLINDWFGLEIAVSDWILEGMNFTFGSQFDTSKIILPVGISFYTFQIISYIVDLYRKEVEPVKNILDFGFYVTFFPQLVAGPIVRAASFIPQMYQPFRLTREEAGQALFYILNGLIKKMIIADYISVNFVDRVYDNPLNYTGLENLMAVYGYSLQIYCDFSGYTDIAIGLAMWMGFRLPLNFHSPYKAPNITDFWRRWHISLSSWLKDYLYIPLGGNRKGKNRTYINLMLTMLLGGLWHGAALRFIVWGALHGIYLAVHKFFLTLFPKQKTTPYKWKWVWIFITFHIVSFTWMSFRGNSMTTVTYMFNQIFNHFEAEHFFTMAKAYNAVWSLILIGFILHWLPTKTKNWYKGRFVLLPIWAKIVATVLIVFILAQFVSADIQPFIYFQF